MRQIQMNLRSIVIASLLLIAACSRNSGESTAGQPESRKPRLAGQALDPVELAARTTIARAAAATGNQAEVARQVGQIQDDFRRSIKLADPAHAVDRETARALAKQIAGVRSAVWIDRENLLAIVSSNQARSYETIDAICVALEPLGDTLGVVVNLQSAAATNGDELEVLSRNCQLASGDRAFMQKARQVDAISPQARAQYRAAKQAAESGPDRAAEAAESQRALEAIAPPLQHPGSH
jgi:hypothetical protein